MSKESIFQKYYKKLAGEGLLKSFLLALTIALFVETLILLAFWFVGIKRYWLSAGISVGVFAALVPSLYFLFFRPDTKAIAKRLDSLGLEERLLTMNELQNDESYIAMRQREDAKQALAKIDPKNVKIVLSRVLIVLLLISVFATGSAATVTTLTNKEIIPAPSDIIKDIINPEQYYTIRYVAEVYGDVISGGDEYVGGIIEGADEQLIAYGENSDFVFALADPDWVFVQWSDETDDPYRMEEFVFVEDDVFNNAFETKDENGKTVKVAFDLERGWEITKDADGNITITIYAYFSRIGDPSGENGELTDDMGENGSEADQPVNGNPDNPGKEGDGESKDSSGKSDNPGDGSSGSEKDNNKIIDGNTDYKSRLEEYKALAKEYEKNGEKVPDELLEMIERYYNILS